MSLYQPLRITILVPNFSQLIFYNVLLAILFTFSPADRWISVTDYLILAE
jgi:hypothetical protein